MDDFAKVFGACIIAILGIAVLIPLSTLFGAVMGWAVGLFFGETILNVLDQLGVRGVTMWQFGAFMGFCGGFMKTKVSAERKSA